MLAIAMIKLKNSLSCASYNGAQHSHIIIRESDVAAKLKSITLTAPQGDWFSFDPDKGRSKAAIMSPLLATGEHAHHRACDCVIVLNQGGQLTVVYIDLKSGNPTGYAGQFKSTRQFMRYAIGLLDEFHQEKLAIVDERYVIFYCSKPLINKATTIAKTEKLRKSRPNEAYKREVSTTAQLYLKELLT